MILYIIINYNISEVIYIGSFIDLTGKVFGMLTVVSKSEIKKYDKICWECICECGNTKIIVGNNLQKGNTKSCGCLSVCLSGEQYGLSKHWFYTRWKDQYSRCNNKEHKDYKNYGGRADNPIKCIWTLEEACEWADSNPIIGEKNHCDRIDNNEHYEPSNVRWLTQAENNRNKREQELKDIRKYETISIIRTNFKERCETRDLNFEDFMEIDSGEKSGTNKKYFYKLKE
ncbi:MAG: hypothetical protein ACRC5M_03480 [Anaeroplasmataceae bacterium]